MNECKPLTGQGVLEDPVLSSFGQQDRIITPSYETLTSFRLAVLTSESMSNHSSTWLPAIPVSRAH